MSAEGSLCPICRSNLVQSIPGAKGTWACINHGDFQGGTGNSGTSAATVQTSAQTAGKATSGNQTKHRGL